MKYRTVGSLIALAAIAGAPSGFAQVTTQPASAAATAPAAAAPADDGGAAGTPNSIPPLPPPDTSGVKPADLPAVRRTLDAPEAWQRAMEQVLSRVEVPELRAQLTEGLNNLAPRLAKGLIDHRGDTAYVTVATYREPGAGGKQAAVALAFEGFGERLDATFYARVLSDMPRASDMPDNPAPKGLALDPGASFYLCYFLSKDGLSAGAIPHEQMKQEVAAAFDHKDSPHPTVSGEAGQPRAVQPAPADVPAGAPVTSTINIGPSYPTEADTGNTYGPGYAPYYYGDWGLYGLGWYNPVIIGQGHREHDWSHWQRWDWSGYKGFKGSAQAGNTTRNPLNETGTTGTGSTGVVTGSSGVSRSVANPAASEQPPVFRPSVREPSVGRSEATAGRSAEAPARASAGAGPARPAAGTPPRVVEPIAQWANLMRLEAGQQREAGPPVEVRTGSGLSSGRESV